MRGNFRHDLELVPGSRAFKLRRRLGPRLVSLALMLAGFGATAVDLAAHRPLVATLQLALSVAFLGLLLRAELDSWRFEGDAAIRRTFSLRRLQFVTLRLEARQVRHVAVEQAARFARAFIVAKNGEEYALVEGDDARVRQIAESFTASVRLARAEPPSKTVH